MKRDEGPMWKAPPRHPLEGAPRTELLDILRAIEEGILPASDAERKMLVDALRWKVFGS